MRTPSRPSSTRFRTTHPVMTLPTRRSPSSPTTPPSSTPPTPRTRSARCPPQVSLLLATLVPSFETTSAIFCPTLQLARPEPSKSGPPPLLARRTHRPHSSRVFSALLTPRLSRSFRSERARNLQPTPLPLTRPAKPTLDQLAPNRVRRGSLSTRNPSLVSLRQSSLVRRIPCAGLSCSLEPPDRLNKEVPAFNFTVSDIVAMQELCGASLASSVLLGLRV